MHKNDWLVVSMNTADRSVNKSRRPWADKPAKLAQKDRDAHWTVKYTKAKPRGGRKSAVGRPRLPGLGL
jgi:hypothetical protein